MKRIMKQIALLTLLVCMATSACADVRGQEMELPDWRAGKESIIRHTGYTLSFNTRTNCPNWVAWELTAAEVENKRVQRDNDFHGDMKVAARNRVEWFDYRGSGYDRGHMCPAGDMKWSAEAMSDCFCMTNICPQTTTLNQQWWEHVERACRRWAKHEGRVYICCGPIYSNKVKPRYIGKKVKVRVPDGFFKVVLSLRNGREKAIGFVYSNDDRRQTMESAATSVDEVERITGIDFFYTLNPRIQTRVESRFNLREWN